MNATIMRSLALCSLLLPGIVRAQVDVTSCGQTVQGTGQLTGNLDCSSELDEAVKLQGKLLLAGFTLTGNPSFDVVSCDLGRCQVEGPGTITGGLDGVRSDRGAKLVNVTITGNAGDGVRTEAAARVTLGSTISGNGGDGVRSKSSAKVQDSTVSGNGADGVRTDRNAKVQRSTISGNTGDGVRSDASAKVQDSTVSDNGGDGIHAERRAKAKRSDVLTNGLDGLQGLKASLKDSTAAGNGTDAACGVTEECADLASVMKPVVRGLSTCETSRVVEGSGNWGVCTLD